MPKQAPQTVGTVIEQLFSELGLRDRYHRAKILASWEDVVGEQIARISTAKRIVGRRLFVHVDNSAWRHELQLRKRDIIQKVNRYSGTSIIDDIKFQ